MKKGLGGLLLLFGIILFAWMGFNRFNLISPQPETQGRSPIVPLLFASGLAGLIIYALGAGTQVRR